MTEAEGMKGADNQPTKKCSVSSCACGGTLYRHCQWFLKVIVNEGCECVMVVQNAIIQGLEIYLQ